MALMDEPIRTAIEHEPGRVRMIAPHPRTGKWKEWILPLVEGTYEYPMGITADQAGAFPPKQVIGDWREGDHNVLSFAVQNSWIGGGQMAESEETESIDRYTEIATLDTRFPLQLYLLPLSKKIPGPNEDGVRVLGDMVVSNVKRTYVAYGLEICSLSGSFPNITASASIDTLDDLPSKWSKPVLFRESGTTIKMFIPQGAAGYQTWDGVTLGTQVTDIEPEFFLVFSRKLWAVDRTGKLFKSLDGIAWQQMEWLDPGYEVRGLVKFLDRYEKPAPYIMTDIMTFVFDENVPALYETELNSAPHLYSFVAAAVWRADMYAALGMGVMRYTLSTVDPVGLDRNTGCGPKYTGYISSLCPSFNDLIAGVSSTIATGATLEESEVNYGTEMYFGSSTAYCHLQRLNASRAWHTMWKAPQPGGTITDITVSTARQDYVAMWGWEGNLWVQQLPTGFDNPEDNPTKHFEPEGQLISSWFDMAMQASRKIGAAWEARAGKLADAKNYFKVEYQIDGDDAGTTDTDQQTWRQLPNGGIVSDPDAINLFMLGENGTFPARAGHESEPAYYGVGFQRMRYRLTAVRDPDDDSLSPTLKSILLDFFKVGRSIKNIAFEVDCSSPEFNTNYGLNNEERRDMLQKLLDLDIFIPVMVGKNWYMIKPAYANAKVQPGTDDRGDVSFSGVQSFDAKQGKV